MLKEFQFQNNRHFAYHTSREDNLTEDEFAHFRLTLLHSHYLAVVEDVPEEEEVLDQDLPDKGILCDNESRTSQSVAPTSQSVTSKLLKK